MRLRLRYTTRMNEKERTKRMKQSEELNVKQKPRTSVTSRVWLTVVLALAALTSTSYADGGHTLFITSAVENANGTVTFPLYKGTSNSDRVLRHDRRFG